MSVKIICQFPAASNRTEIVIGKDLLHDVANFCNIAKRFAIIADSFTERAFGKTLKMRLQDAGFEAHLFFFPQGEASKSRATKALIEDAMFAQGLGRDIAVIALGGGVVLDVAGFIASTFCRGVPLILLPTTLLAMADSAIGGKNGVDTPHGKNLIGTIYQPSYVIIDTSFLNSLPPTDVKNGLVEMIKHGLIRDRSYFEYLLTHLETPLSDLDYAIQRSVEIKMEIVQADERESHTRRLLNFGHTVGHALEVVSKYALKHGEAVAIGIIAESYLAYLLKKLSKDDFETVYSSIQALGLPLALPEGCSVEALLDAMRFDKKANLGKARFVLLEAIGSAHDCVDVDTAIVEKTLNWMLHDLRANSRAIL